MLRVRGEHVGHQSETLRRELRLDHAPVVGSTVPVYEPLVLEAIHHVRDVAAGHEELVGELAQGERAEVIKYAWLHRGAKRRAAAWLAANTT